MPKKASTKVESVICANTDLSLADEKMASAYRKAKQLNPEITISQKAWLTQRNECKDAECLRTVIVERSKILTLMLPSPEQAAKEPSQSISHTNNLPAVCGGQVEPNNTAHTNEAAAPGEHKSAEQQNNKQGGSLPASLEDPTLFDIVGIHLGMTVDEVQAALRAYNKSLVITNIKTKTPNGEDVISIVTAAAYRNGNVDYLNAEQIGIGFTITKPMVSYVVVRHVAFPEDKQPLISAIGKQLKEKYGEPSMVDDNKYMQWVFDGNQKKMYVTSASDDRFINSVFSRCSHGIDFGRLITGPVTDIGMDASGAYGVPTHVYVECGISLSIMYGCCAGNPDLLPRLEERLFSDKLATYDLRNVQNKERDLQEQKHEQENERASEVKPAL